eukprot:6363876-Amphidinium_carterae.2
MAFFRLSVSCLRASSSRIGRGSSHNTRRRGMLEVRSEVPHLSETVQCKVEVMLAVAIHPSSTIFELKGEAFQVVLQHVCHLVVSTLYALKHMLMPCPCFMISALSDFLIESI